MRDVAMLHPVDAFQASTRPSSTLAVHGRGNADLLVAGITGAQLIWFEGARHAYFLEHRTAASAAVLAHLAANPLR